MNSQNIYGYLRVSTDKQTVEGNKNELILKIHELGLNTQCIIWIEETISGAKHWKNRKLGQIIPELKTGDIFITSEVSRIARTISHIFEFISLLLEKQIKIYFTKSSFPVDGSVSSQTIMFALSITAQLERELIASRTKSALQKMKEGVVLGRPQGHMILDIHLDEIKKLINEGVKLKRIAQKFSSSAVTMSKFVKKHNLNSTVKNQPSEGRIK